MLLLAPGLFRLDVAISDDTIRTMVRNLSAGKLRMDDSVDAGGPRGIAVGEAPAYRPSSSRVRFALGTGPDRVTVSVNLGLLRFADRGTVRMTAQAVVREAVAGSG